MIKRKYGDRAGWSRIINRRFIQARLHEEHFSGYVTLLKIDQVTEPLFVDYGNRRLCIVDEGFIWLQHFPQDKQFSVTTMFDSDGKIVQWYIDICQCNGMDSGRPWMDDLFLDIVVLPEGKIILKDEHELKAALLSGAINHELFKKAHSEAKTIIKLIQEKEFPLLNLSKIHKDHLINKLE